MTLKDFFSKNPEVAIAFSGGVDSAYLLYMATRHARRVRAYYVKTAFQPAFELRDAERLAKELGADMKVLTVDALSDARVRENPADRCYFCKHNLFSFILGAAREDGFSVLIDGNNASDDTADRPGMRAVEELKVLSPLRMCGLTKPEIRALSKEAGLFTHDKPAYACLATRIPTGRAIDEETLSKVERAEEALFKLGFSDLRVRVMGDNAKIQLKSEALPHAIEVRGQILAALSPLFSDVLLDLKER